MEHVEVSDSTVASDNTVIHPLSPDKRPSSFAKAPLALTAIAGAESIPPPSRDLTTNHTSISQENLRSDIPSVSLAYLEITLKLVIKEIIIGGGGGRVPVPGRLKRAYLAPLRAAKRQLLYRIIP
ncbi:hypothetical protein QBC46DRAFT_414753 [Diplogelasinospora grovesii]|uniref:Uncharacterized protein n=1 Tax=Diplogelasinospora grovesii TaxID=303347 RepID=A0AAN6MWB9_9PEZI|nr:hypothetical protein QBC46DRAFT_414753 [Diplogelasinospora grovesii]